MRNIFIRIFSLIVLISLLSACAGNTGGSSAPPAPVDVTLSSLTIVTKGNLVRVGSTKQYHAIGGFSDGTYADLTESVTWVSSQSNIATISNTTNAKGLATGVANGDTLISANYESISAESVSLTVSTAPLTTITISVPDNSVPLGVTQEFTATGVNADNQSYDITDLVGWVSATPSIGTIDTNGLFSPVSVGNTNISASFEGVTSNTISMTVTDATITGFTVVPASNFGPYDVPTQFNAYATYSDDSELDVTNLTTWASSNTSVATINPAGLLTPVSVGTTVITGTFNGFMQDITYTVTSAELETVLVGIQYNTVGLNMYQRVHAAAIYSDGTFIEISEYATWASSSSANIVVDNETGIMRSIAAGTSNLTASFNGVTSAPFLVTVNSTTLSQIILNRDDVTIPEYTEIAYHASAIYSDNSVYDYDYGVTWNSDDLSVADIGLNSGLAIGFGIGTANITATDRSTGLITSAPSVLTVSDASVVGITITPLVSSIPDGNSVQFIATGLLDNGGFVDLTDVATWASSNTAVATIDTFGLALAVAPSGTTNITATFNGITSSPSTLTATAAVLASINITPVNITPGSSINLPQGSTQNFTAEGVYSDGSTNDLTTLVTWASSASGNVSISNENGTKGQARAVNSSGAANITATFNGITSSPTMVTATAAELVSIAITPIGAVIPNGLTQQYTATGTYTNATTQNITSSVTWASSNTAVATINAATGLATAVATSGTTDITATLGSITSDTAVLTADDEILVSIAITPGTATYSLGTTTQQQLTATGTYSDTTSADITNSVVWASDAISIVNVMNTGTPGMAFFFGAGVANITATQDDVEIVSPAIMITITP